MSDETEVKEAIDIKPPPPVTEAELPQVKPGPARDAAAMIPVGERGYITPENFAQMADIAKAMANAKEAVPMHVRGNLGMSIALHDMAMAWGFSPYMLANESSVINGRLGFTSHVFRAVMDKRAGLRGRLRVDYNGNGDERTCTVTGHFRNEVDPLSYTTPPRKQIMPVIGPKTDRNGTPILGEDRKPVMVRKGSPLWDTDPDRQQFYYASRAFCRMYCPEVMLGLFGVDELQDMAAGMAADRATDITSDVDALTARLKAAQEPGEGFSHEHVEKALNHRAKPKKKAKRR